MKILHDDYPLKNIVYIIHFSPGNRGKNYAMYAKQFPHLFEVVGVAEPRQYARQLFQSIYNLPNNRSVNAATYLT